MLYDFRVAMELIQDSLSGINCLCGILGFPEGTNGPIDFQNNCYIRNLCAVSRMCCKTYSGTVVLAHASDTPLAKFCMPLWLQLWL